MNRFASPLRRLLAACSSRPAPLVPRVRSAAPARRALHAFALAGALSALCAAPLAHAAPPPLKIGYSDWPGWVAFQVALDKGWFKDAGVDVDFEWFDYSASLDAFSAGKLDAVTVTNGDALVTGASGAKNTMILLTDYSAGNDMIIAKPPLRSVEQLKGRKIGVELAWWTIYWSRPRCRSTA